MGAQFSHWQYGSPFRRIGWLARYKVFRTAADVVRTQMSPSNLTDWLFSLLLCCHDKTPWLKSSLGRREFIWLPGYLVHPQGKPEQECEGRNLEVVPEVEAMAVLLLACSSPRLVQFAFLYSSWLPVQGDPSHSELTPLYQLFIKNTPKTGQCDGGNSSIKVPCPQVTLVCG